ncbi:MAG: hypothetical protein Q9223_004776 [Gallowayella weberi]
MEDPNLIATLIPFDDYRRAENAREATPARDQQNDGHSKYDSTHRLQLTFDEKPKDTRGYCFGTDQQKCDVLLGNRGAYDISGLHFWITFDDTIDKRGPRLILRDSSTNGTAVGYNDQAIKEVRRHFTWILDLEKEEGKWEVVVNVRELRFKVELASHETCKAKYDEKVEDFLRRKSGTLPSVDGLGIDSYTTTAQTSQASTPKQLPIYISERELGHGSFGRVDRVIDVSTGVVYARKEFYEPRWGKNEECRREQEEHWLDQARREIRIMRENSHVSITTQWVGWDLTIRKENIVQVVASRDGPLPFLVMPYFSLGNLEDLHSESPITGEEAIFVLFQALNALRYLHPRGMAHRDLKPANVLVESRVPLSVKLADFGLANDQPDLKTLCGTQLYTAPEVYLGERYTASIDLWQKRGQHKRSKMEEWGHIWCRRIVDKANDWDADNLIDLLVTGMLRMRPEERLSADACLTKGYELGLFHGHSHDYGTATPTQRTALQGETSDDDGSTTILLGALWDTEESSMHIANNRTGCRNLDHTSGVLESHSLQGPSSPSNENNRSSQLGSFGPAFNQLGSSGQSSADLSYPLKAGLKCPGGLKRQRSPVVGSAKDSKQRPDQTSTNRGSVTVIPMETEGHLSKRNVQNMKTMLAGNLDDQNEGRRKVTDFDERHIQLETDNKIILMRKEDCFLNATQILTLANKNANDRKYLLSLMKEQTEVQVLPPVTDIPYSCSWVNFQHGLILCQHLKLEHQLQPLISYGLRAQRDNCKRVEQVHDYLTEV